MVAEGVTAPTHWEERSRDMAKGKDAPKRETRKPKKTATPKN